MKRHLILHPFLFGLYPIVSLYALNVGQTSFADTFRPGLITIVISGMLLWILSKLVKNIQRAALAVSAAVLLFFSFGHVYYYLETLAPSSIVSRADLLAALWTASLILIPWFSLRIVPENAVRSLTPLLNLMSVTSLIIASMNIGAYWLRNGNSSTVPVTAAAELNPEHISAPKNAPDIYYLIVDTYGRQDVLQDLYHEDRQEFMDFLRKHGFVITKESTSNYSQTYLSLASSTNMQYIDKLIPIQPESNDRQALVQLLFHNEIERFLKQRGYHTIFIASDFFSFPNAEFDQFIDVSSTKGLLGFSFFEELLMNYSFGILFLDVNAENLHRQVLNQSIEILKEQSLFPGPKFVLFYISLLHSPFIFDKDGKPIEPIGSVNNVTPEDYEKGYPGQLVYTDKVLQEAVQTILLNSERPPVIIIQGDHGPAMHFDMDSLHNSICLRERYGIMNAYFLPGVDANLYDKITPVNSFRVIFNTYFNQDFDLLPDRSYYATWDKPYIFTDVTDRTDECLPLQARPVRH